MMKMNLKNIFFGFSGLSFCLILFSLAHEVQSAETINVASLCDRYNGTVDLRDRNIAILNYEGPMPMECEILLAYTSWQYIVISLYEWDLKFDEKLVFRDLYTEVSLTGKTKWNGEKVFIFKGQTTIHFTANDTYSSIHNNKFKFLYTVSDIGSLICKNSDFACNNKICLNDHSLVCDGMNNCGDWSDEIDCERSCTSNEFECANSKCIPKYKLCNDKNDCGDESDEEMCHPGSDCRLSYQYKCDNTICISSNAVCDNKNDCGDWSDEINCHRECDLHQFPCSNKKCIDEWKVCDGYNNCGDNSDEKNCWSCSSLQFKCSNGLCIPKNSVCNNRNDCGDFSDERDCNVAGGNVLEERNKSLSPWYIAIIICAVLLAIIVVTFFSILIRNRVADKKKKTRNQLPNTSSNSGVHHVHPPYLMNRIRQSFRSGRQTASPSSRPRVDIPPTTDISEPHTHQVPSMYPQLQSSVNSTDVHNVQPPNLLERVRQSFRSGRQSTPSSTQSSHNIYSAPVTTGEQIYQVPSMYPQLHPGFDNPEFKIEE